VGLPGAVAEVDAEVGLPGCVGEVVVVDAEELGVPNDRAAPSGGDVGALAGPAWQVMRAV
jgi:hypothetical protein